jgi:hypothetical protein
LSEATYLERSFDQAAQLRDRGRALPEELAGRANVALNVLHIGGTFIVQDLIGAVIGCWPAEYERHPLIAYQAAFGAALSLQFVAGCGLHGLARTLSGRRFGPELDRL